MKRISVIVAITVVALFSCAVSYAQDPVKTKRVFADGTVSINTSDICRKVDGFMGPTPLDIRIKNDTIKDIIPLANEETPAYFRAASALLKKWIGLSTEKGLTLKVDAVTGATFTSDALIANVRAGLKEYQEYQETKKK